MNEKDHLIVIAARNLFMRYGYVKTTIGDIAAEAGVARQTVYNAFPGKEEILRAVVREAGEEAYHRVMDAWASVETIDEKLSLFHELGPLSWFEVMRAAPDWAALMDGIYAAASEELAAIDAKWNAAFLEILDVAAPSERPASASNQEIVEFFYFSSLNAKYGARDVAHFRSRLATIKIATNALLKENV